MAKLKFYFGTMGQGKSTMLLQMKNNFDLITEDVLVLTVDRKYEEEEEGKAEVKSRIDLHTKAIYIKEDIDIYDFILDYIENKKQINNILIDEIQFATEEQIEELARLVDYHNINIFCFGLLTNFKSRLFTSSKRLIELADEKTELQLKSLCWCGSKATVNAKTKNGFIEFSGDEVEVGDVTIENKGIKYEKLCRKHYFELSTKKVAKLGGLI